MFISAGNSGPGVNTVGDPACGGKVVSVGAYITDATWQSQLRLDCAVRPTTCTRSARAARARTAASSRTIVAPGAAVSTTPMWQPGGPVAGTYALPPGYSMLNGTSMASPQAAGAAALLVSAAKQAGVQHQPDQLRQAMSSSARFLDRLRRATSRATA